MITLGIDLASQPEESAACRITWRDGAAIAEVVTYPLDDAAILELVPGADITGVDVPFGWPEPLIRAVGARGSANIWPPGHTRGFVFRTTDEWVKDLIGQQPLSVAADKIGWPAVRAARLIGALDQRGVAVTRSGIGSRLVEVYPAAALRRWSFPYARYKQKKGQAVLAALAENLFGRPWLRFASGAREAYCATDHCFDALIAALVARAHACGLCEPIPVEHQNIAGIEGWIALPLPNSLDVLSTAAPQ